MCAALPSAIIDLIERTAQDSLVVNGGRLFALLEKPMLGRFVGHPAGELIDFYALTADQVAYHDEPPSKLAGFCLLDPHSRKGEKIWVAIDYSSKLLFSMSREWVWNDIRQATIRYCDKRAWWLP